MRLSRAWTSDRHFIHRSRQIVPQSALCETEFESTLTGSGPMRCYANSMFSKRIAIAVGLTLN
jgi:hypothetical protein